MSSPLDPLLLTQRIDTVLDILVAGDTASAIRNLEILREELAQSIKDRDMKPVDSGKSPWEI